MERAPHLSSKVFAVLLAAAALAAPLRAADPPLDQATRSLYAARLAGNAAGRFGGLAGSPLVGVAPVPILETIVAWDRLRRDSYQGNFAEYALFLRANPDWPQALTIRRAAEKAMDDSVAAPDRLAYFKQFPPTSPTARLRLGEALVLLGRKPEAVVAARDAWVSAGLDETAESRLLALFEPDLTPDNHLGRADRLLWSGQTTAAARLLPRLDMDHRLWLLARIALRTSADAANVEARLGGVPASLRDDPGLLLDRALWLRRSGRPEAAQTLLATTDLPPGRVLDPEAWLRNRLDFARQAWRAGNFETAWRLAGRHAAYGPATAPADRPLAERQLYVESEWLAGWLALRKLGRPADAITAFQNVRRAAQTPLSQTRGDYWAGRALEAAGRPAEARAAYEAAAAHVDCFYGQLAAERIDRPLVLRRLPTVLVPADVASTFRAEPLVRAATALGDIGDHDRQTLFLRALADRADGPLRQALLAGLAAPLARRDAGVLAGKAARGDGELALIDAAFPLLDLPADLAPAFTIIHAIGRQESQFDVGAMSAANARGLMQLLPGTAAEQAGKLGLPVSTSQLTTDPIYNVRLGSGYFARLRDNFAGSHVLAVAAYNAGPGNARKFIALNGDPRDAGADMVDWIEAIPIAETRNYVQRVLENAVMYDLLHPQTSVMPDRNRLSAYLGKTVPG